MLGFAYSLTNNEDEAMELFQDTALKVLDSKDKYVDKDNFVGWVFTIMRNIFINRYRRASRNKVFLDNSDNCYILNIPDDCLDNCCCDNNWTLNDICFILKSFDKNHRIPLSMFLFGYKYTEIAEFMNMPLGTVKSRIYFAKRKLQSILKEYK